MRTLSVTFIEAIARRATGEVPVILLRLTHPDLAEPILLSSNPTERHSDTPVYKTVSRGDDYLFCPMEVVLPDDAADSVPRARLQISNVDRRTITAMRSTPTPAKVRMEIVLASAPDDIEIDWPEFDLSGAEYDANQISFDLTMNDIALEPYPAQTFKPAWFPGLF